MTFPGLLLFVCSPIWFFPSFSKRRSPVLTTRTFISAHAPACFSLMVDCRGRTVTLFKQYLSSRSAVSQHFTLKVWRWNASTLNGIYQHIPGKCWGKWWETLVLACGNWFCVRCSLRWPYDSGAGLCILRIKTFPMLAFSNPGNEIILVCDELKTTVCVITLPQTVAYRHVPDTSTARSLCSFQLWFWSRCKFPRESLHVQVWNCFCALFISTLGTFSVVGNHTNTEHVSLRRRSSIIHKRACGPFW